MTFAAGFLSVVGICVFGILTFLIVAAWREDRENRRERLSNGEGAVGQSSLAPEEWDPLANLFEDAETPARLVRRREVGGRTRTTKTRTP